MNVGSGGVLRHSCRCPIERFPIGRSTENGIIDRLEVQPQPIYVNRGAAGAPGDSTIEEFVAEHGARIPAMVEHPHQRAAVILLIALSSFVDMRIV